MLQYVRMSQVCVTHAIPLNQVCVRDECSRMLCQWLLLNNEVCSCMLSMLQCVWDKLVWATYTIRQLCVCHARVWVMLQGETAWCRACNTCYSVPQIIALPNSHVSENSTTHSGTVPQPQPWFRTQIAGSQRPTIVFEWRVRDVCIAGKCHASSHLFAQSIKYLLSKVRLAMWRHACWCREKWRLGYDRTAISIIKCCIHQHTFYSEVLTHSLCEGCMYIRTYQKHLSWK